MTAPTRIEQHRELASVIGRDERRRREIAHELHEDAAQTLAGVLLALESPDDPIAIAEARSHLEATVIALRRLATTLRPPVLDHLGLGPALRRLAGDGEFALHLAIRGRLPAEVETVVYRVIEEALELVQPPVRVVVTQTPREVELEITGDGSSPGADQSVLRARLAVVGGRLEVYRGGAELRAFVPIAPEGF